MVPALCFGAATPAAEVVTGCAVFSAVGVVLNIVVISWHRRLRKQRGIDFVHPIFQLIQEAQLWTYMVSMLHQCAVYPPFVVWGWLSWLDSQRQRAVADPSAEHQFSWWATEPGSLWPQGSQPDMWQLRVFLYAFFGYLLRDLMVRMRCKC